MDPIAVGVLGWRNAQTNAGHGPDPGGIINNAKITGPMLATGVEVHVLLPTEKGRAVGEHLKIEMQIGRWRGNRDGCSADARRARNRH